MEAPQLQVEHPRRRAEVRGLLADASATALFMLAYEWAKQQLLPGIGVWQSHFITIGVVTVLATGMAWRTRRRLARLNSSLDSLVHKLDAELAATHENEARKDAILNASLDSIVSIDHRGRITEFNPAAERTFGLNRAQAIGRNVGETLVPPALRAAHTSGMARYLSTGQSHILGTRIETTGVRADGSEFPVEIAITRVDVPGPPSFTAYLRDITDRRRLEEQLRGSQKMEATGRLAGGIAHDFNNLLMVIMGHCGELLHGQASGAEVVSAATDIQAAAERGATLTRQLLAFSRQQVMQPAVLNLDTVVRDLERMLRRIVTEAIEMVVVAQPGLGSVRADPGQIEQVILNLVVNARDAMPGGGTLTLRTANVDLDESYVREHALVQPGAYVMLSVSDTGIGMDEATKSHLFEPFFTTKGLGRGTGLGLSIVHGIVTQSGGHVWVYSEVGKGTAFKVYLPRVAGAVTARVPAAPAAQVARGTETILLVEDDPQLRQLCESTVSSYGYRVLTAASAREAEAISADQDQTIDLLLTDIVMPGMNGWDLSRRLLLTRPALRIIFMSGYTDHAIVNPDKEDAGWAFLQKPFSPSLLRSRIREVLDAPAASAEPR